MTDPELRFAPAEWQYGGDLGKAPPCLLARGDGLPFSWADWATIDEYITSWFDLSDELDTAEMKRYNTPAAFQEYVRRSDRPTALLSLRFPIGSTVVPSGLSLQELNGKEGEVVRFSRERVGVQFPDREVLALKPERLALVRVVEQPVDAEMPPAGLVEDEQAAKRRRAAEAAALREKEARQIVRRFLECLDQDTFPEMGELHLFGLGGEYKARATDALAVWQGAAKSGHVTEDALTEALVQDRVREYFVGVTRTLADSRDKNCLYAKTVLERNFAALEFESL